MRPESAAESNLIFSKADDVHVDLLLLQLLGDLHQLLLVGLDGRSDESHDPGEAEGLKSKTALLRYCWLCK